MKSLKWTAHTSKGAQNVIESVIKRWDRVCESLKIFISRVHFFETWTILVADWIQIGVIISMSENGYEWYTIYPIDICVEKFFKIEKVCMRNKNFHHFTNSHLGLRNTFCYVLWPLRCLCHRFFKTYQIFAEKLKVSLPYTFEKWKYAHSLKHKLGIWGLYIENLFWGLSSTLKKETFVQFIFKISCLLEEKMLIEISKFVFFCENSKKTTS